MWTYKQTTGDLFHGAQHIATGYSGRGEGLDNPEMQGVTATGPIPQGQWAIGEPYNSPRTGPYTLPLTAQDGDGDDVHDATGRSAFRIHGDNSAMNHSASHGCIILQRAIRTQIWESGDHLLEVVA